MKLRTDDIATMQVTLGADCAARGYTVTVETFDYGFMVGVGFEDPKTIVRIKPWKRINKVLQFLHLQPHQFGPYRRGFKMRNDSNVRETIRWWVRREVDDAELRRLDRERKALYVAVRET